MTIGRLKVELEAFNVIQHVATALAVVEDRKGKESAPAYQKPKLSFHRGKERVDCNLNRVARGKNRWNGGI